MKKLRFFDSLKFVRFVVAVVAATFILNVAHAATLPAGYTELEYLESTGTQYIDTGLTAGSNTRVLAQYKLTNTIFTFPISVRDTASAGAGFGVGVNGSEQFISDYNGNRQTFTTITPNTTDIITVDKNKNVCTISIGGQSETVTNTASTFTTTNTLPLFAQNTNGSVSSGKYAFYSFKMWEGDTLVRDMVPAKYGNTVGMYDTVSGQFFTNAGTGTFVAGEWQIKIATTKYNEESFAPVKTDLSAAVNAVEYVVSNTMSQAQAIDQIANEKQTRPDEGCDAKYCLLVEDEDGTPHWYPIAGANGVAHNLPDGYTELQYLQSSGTQNIITDLTGFDTGNWEIYTKFMSTSETQTSYGYIVSVYGGESTNSYRVIFSKTDGQRFLLSGNNKAGAGNITVVGEVNRVYEATVKNGSVVFDGVTYETPTQGTALANNVPLTIFGGVNGNPRAKARIYSVKATQDGVLRANYIPAKRNSDNALGMYDMVSGQFFTNSGTGVFTGPEM